MEIALVSDIHGSAKGLQSVLEVMDKEGIEKLVLLGDILYHGPRNPLPPGHDPQLCFALLNDRASHITAVRGNCDAEVDQMVLSFPCMADYILMEDEYYRFFLTHGHVYGPDRLPPLPAGEKPWVFCSGHTHVKVDCLKDGVRYINPGSVSLPKDGSASFMIYREGSFEVRTVDL